MNATAKISFEYITYTCFQTKTNFRHQFKNQISFFYSCFISTIHIHTKTEKETLQTRAHLFVYCIGIRHSCDNVYAQVFRESGISKPLKQINKKYQIQMRYVFILNVVVNCF